MAHEDIFRIWKVKKIGYDPDLCKVCKINLNTFFGSSVFLLPNNIERGLEALQMYGVYFGKPEFKQGLWHTHILSVDVRA